MTNRHHQYSKYPMASSIRPLNKLYLTLIENVEIPAATFISDQKFANASFLCFYSFHTIQHNKPELQVLVAWLNAVDQVNRLSDNQRVEICKIQFHNIYYEFDSKKLDKIGHNDCPKLLDKPLQKQQLSPVFAKPKSLKGHIKQKKRAKTDSRKKQDFKRIMNYRLPNHNGLLNRVKLVGPRHNRRFKFASAHKRHLLRNKSRNNLMRKRKARYICKADVERVKKMIPNWKNSKFKANH